MTFVRLSLKRLFENQFWMHQNRDERRALISVLNCLYSQSPYFVLHLHPKCISRWSFNSELSAAVIQTEIN